MARFLLIHGAAHGAWCWRDVIPALQALGHEARAIDLPGNGADPTPVEDVTLDLWAGAIVDAARDMGGDVILVGHSLGGYAITAAAELSPDPFARLVYVCAYTPWPGKTLSEMRFLHDEQPLHKARVMSPDGLWLGFNPDMIEDVFYHDCPPETLDYARRHLCRQATKPSQTVVDLSENTANMARSYIVCSKDRAVPPPLQRIMAAKFDPENVYELDSAHSPFFAVPDKLAELLGDIAVGK